MKTLSENESKIKQICKLFVSDKGVIYFTSPDGKKVNCDFDRGRCDSLILVVTRFTPAL